MKSANCSGLEYGLDRGNVTFYNVTGVSVTPAPSLISLGSKQVHSIIAFISMGNKT